MNQVGFYKNHPWNGWKFNCFNSITPFSFDFNDWMLFSAESPNAYGARGLSKGNIYTRDGKLIASFAQEGLLRPKKK